MSKQTEALKLALENICSAKLCEFNSMSSRHEMIRLMDAAITAIREALTEQPAQQPYDTHAAPGQSFDTHGRTPPAQNELAYQYLLAEIRHMTAELARLRAVSAQALEALEPMENSRDDTAIQRAITDLREALAELPAQQDQGQSCYCPNCEALSKELAALKEQQQEPVAYDKTEINCFAQDLYDQKMREGKRGHYESMFYVIHQCIKKVSPPASKPWVGLTDEDVTWLCNTAKSHEQTWGMFVRAIEAKLREKNA